MDDPDIWVARLWHLNLVYKGKMKWIMQDIKINREQADTLTLLVIIYLAWMMGCNIWSVLQIPLTLYVLHKVYEHNVIPQVGFLPSNVLLISIMVWFQVPALWLTLMALALGHRTTSVKKVTSRQGYHLWKQHSAEPNERLSVLLNDVLEGFNLELFGGTANVELIGTPDFNNIQDEFEAIDNIAYLRDIERQSVSVELGSVVVAVTIIGLMIRGVPGALLVLALSTLAFTALKSQHRETRHEVFQVNSRIPIPLHDGVYRVRRGNAGIQRAMGISYVQDGTLYTRYHVTKGASLDIAGTTYRPVYVDKHMDRIAYGRTPSYVKMRDGDEVYVALAGPYSNNINVYRSRVRVHKGEVYHQCMQSIPGTSGSPMFKEIVTKSLDLEGNEIESRTFRYAGSTGEYRECNPEEKITRSNISGFERSMTSDKDTSIPDRIRPGYFAQIFSHPGSGKTRTLIPERVKDGLDAFGRVFVIVPHRGVAAEAYDVLAPLFPEQVCKNVSSATRHQRGSYKYPIMIIAHDNYLDKMMSEAELYTQHALYIVDEAHTQSTKTMHLLDQLRDKVLRLKQGALIEFTATGFLYGKEAMAMSEHSNHDIEDIPVDESGAVRHILENHHNKKILVFVTSIGGADRFSQQNLLKLMVREGYVGNYVNLESKTFEANFLAAKEMEKGVIFTTDISECGVNLDPDIVVDFRMSKKMVYANNSVRLVRVPIDEMSRIQRRGRVGRSKPGTYVYLEGHTVVSNPQRAEHLDRAILADAFQLRMDNPQYKGRLPVQLSRAQVSAWYSSGRNINSPFTADLLFRKDGVLKNPSELAESVALWKYGGTVSVPGMYSLKVRWWDDRDREVLFEILRSSGEKVPHHTQHEPLSSALSALVRKMRYSAMHALGFRLTIKEDPPEEEEAEDDGEND